MDLVRLEYFLKAAELQHFTKAAQALNITQPTMSAAIRNLEKEMGVSLFENSGRNIKLTRAGRIMQKHASAIMQELNEAKEEISQLQMLMDNQVVIAGPTQAINTRIMQKVISRIPNVNITCLPAFGQDGQECLDSNKADLWIQSPMHQIDGYSCIPLAADPLDVVLPADHPLASRTSVRPEELSGEDFVSYPPNDLRFFIDRVCRDAGFKPRVVCEMVTFAEMLPLIPTRRVAALVPSGACSIYRNTPEIAILPAEGCEDMVLGLIYPDDKPLRPSVQVVRDAIISGYAEEHLPQPY